MRIVRSSVLAMTVSTSVVLFLAASQTRARAAGAGDPQFIPTGVTITPNAVPGSRFEPLNPDVPDDPHFTVDHAVSMAVSPDRKTLLVLTSGYNSENFTSGANKGSPNPALSQEYVFVYDVQYDEPIKRQVLTVPNTLEGITWNPNGLEFYVTGWNLDASTGAFTDDDVFVFDLDPIAQDWKPNVNATVKLDHLPAADPTNPAPACAVYANRCVPGLAVSPAPAGVAVTGDGSRLVVANYENDSISLVDVASHQKVGELDLRPGGGAPGGTYPFWVAIQGSNTAFVSSPRDHEIIIVTSLRTHPTISGRIKLKGEPTKLLLNRDQTLLFVVEASRDAVAVVNTRTRHILEEINTTAPLSTYDPRTFRGSNPTGLTLSPDESRLYVTNGGANSLAIIALNHDDRDHDGDDEDLNPRGRVVGLVPTGWYPEAVATDQDGQFLYVVNGKSNAGPDPQACRDKGSLNPDGSAGSEADCNAANQYVWQLTKAGFLSFPVPREEALEKLTDQVAANNRYGRRPKQNEERLVSFLRAHVQHIIYIVKENRTYDQILGDLPVGNGDPALTVYPKTVTPNHHELATRFVDLDNFYDSGEVSGDGWNWSTSAQANDTIEKTEPINYAGRGLNYDYEGTNRNINVGYATLAERLAANPVTPTDPNVLPGTADVSAPDVDGEQGAAYLWDAAMRSGVTLRNYGFFIDLTRYSLPAPVGIPLIREPFLEAPPLTVAFATKAALQPVTDPYFRGYDNKFPDYWRVQEWAREFDNYEANGNLPNLEFVRVMHDHTGNFTTAIDGLDTPTIQTADNDYAVGLIVQKVSHSQRYRDNTLIFVLEDDSQDGPDHVDAHRSLLLAAGAYIKRGVVVSNAYTTVSVIRTIVDVLGIDHFNVNESSAEPMTAIFQQDAKAWAFDAIVPDILKQSSLPLPAAFARNRNRAIDSVELTATRVHHDAAYWEAQTRGFDFSVEDRLDAGLYNQILWHGIMGDDVPYPEERSGADLRKNRKALLKAYRESLGHPRTVAVTNATVR